MKLTKYVVTLAIFTVAIIGTTQESVAQTSFGASYEIRQEAPKKGFGVRVENDIFQKFPIINLGIRAHFSYFNEENDITREDGSTSISFGQKVTNYDYGLALVGDVKVEPFSPYVGLGLGASTLDVSRSDLPENSAFDDDAKDSAIYWNGFAGARIDIMGIQPFVEYRLEDVSNYQ